jgi:hypothetical protein
LCCSPKIIRIIKLRMRWVGYVACKIVVWEPKGKGAVYRRENSNRILLKKILKACDVKVLTGFI